MKVNAAANTLMFSVKMMKTSVAVIHLQSKLDEIAVAEKKIWWERYLRGAIQFRGVGIPEIRKSIADWREETGIASLPDEEQLFVALALFEESVAEDKLAAILFLQEYLQDRLPWRSLFESYEALYKRNLIFDWNTCDWFCVRVLGPTLLREGKSCAKVLCTWSGAENLWQARSGVVPFIKVASDANFYPDIEEVSGNLLQRGERFAKTSVGWLLREVSRYDPEFVKKFIQKYHRQFSLESVRNATKYFTKSEAMRYVAMVKNSEQSAAGDA